jgi:hypothetical protein
MIIDANIFTHVFHMGGSLLLGDDARKVLWRLLTWEQ